MNRLLLIDAYAMIFRAYYAFIKTPRVTSIGENTSAIFGFVKTLEDLTKELQPTHIAVGFDPKGPTFRHEAYEQYKAQRPETPEDIRKAVPIIKDILNAMHITILEVPGYEADDVIGTMALTAGREGFEVFMATPDKDYGQLVDEHIYMYRPRHTGGFEQMGPAEVCAKYGLTNKMQVVDLLALMGDASDNVPGCKGVGEKTAVQLLQQFGSVDNLLEHTGELKGALKTKVETQVDQIHFSKFLVTIKTDVPISVTPDDLILRQPDLPALIPIYQRLEFNSFLRTMGVNDASSKAPTHTDAVTRPLRDQSLTVPFEGDLTLDLFAEPANQLPTYDTIENRLCQYLLNPEAGFNPYKEPDWEALKADSALYALYQDVELPLVPVLRKMEQAGVRFDLPLLNEAEKQLTTELTALESEIYELAHTTFNINSPAQVGEVLFSDMQLDPKQKRGKSGKYSTSEEVLQAIRDKHPIVGKILEQRELKKLISTYIAPLPTYINPKTGKIHTTYNQTTTATGRLSSSNPNLQNLPIRSERGQLIRQAVIPDDGCVFLSADYSQIELRLMAHFSGDPHLTDAFLKGQDIHAATAAKIFRVPIEEVTKDMRRRAKTANFGILYGISAFGLAQQLDCPRSEAKQLIDDYFASFPKVVEFIERQKEFARTHGYVETLFGRKRYLPDILSHNANVRAFAERNAVNAPIQGTAADIIKMAMVSIDRSLSSLPALTPASYPMIMQVHDELNFNVPEALLEKVKTIVVDEMQNVVHLSVPLIASAGAGSNWLAAH